MDGSDWRTQIQPDSRQRIVNKITETMKRHVPFSGQEGLHELKEIAVRFEEKIYAEATSLRDYLRKISLKMLTMAMKSQNQPGSASNSKNPQDPVAPSHCYSDCVAEEFDYNEEGDSIPWETSSDSSDGSNA